MKIALDEHIAPKVGEAISSLLEDDRNGQVEVVLARDYASAPAINDVPWLEKFVADGGTVVITGDRKMLTRPPEIKALNDLGLIVFFAPSSWCHMTFMDRASYLLRWWGDILQCAKKSKKPNFWKLPDTWSSNKASIKEIKKK